MTTKKVSVPEAAKKRDEVLFIRNLPSNVKHSFKAWCARRDLNMVHVVAELMSQVTAAGGGGEGGVIKVEDVVRGARHRKGD
jgi:hypothetical protein